MDLLSNFVVIQVGAAIVLVLLFTYLYRWTHNKLYRTYVFILLPIILYIFSHKLLYSAEFLEDALSFARLQMLSLAAMLIFYLDFSLIFTGKKSSIIATIMKWILLIVPLIRLSDHGLMIYSDIKGVKTIELPWGEIIQKIDAHLNLFGMVYHGFLLAIILYVFSLSLQFFMEKGENSKPFLMINFLLIGTAFHDILLELFNWNWIYLSEVLITLNFLFMGAILARAMLNGLMYTQKVSDVDQILSHTDRMSSIGKVTSGLIHEIKNHFSAIMGLISLSKSELKDQNYVKVMQYLDDLEEITDNSVDDLKKMLQYSRNESSEKDDIEIINFVKKSCQLIKYALPKSIVLKTEINCDRGYISGCQVDLQNALLNLAINSRDAIDGNGEIVFSLSSFQEKDQLFYEISVHDNGNGIPEDIQKQIFQPFFTTKSETAGTGIGLDAVNRVVENHGGNIRFQSSDSGTTFFLNFPASK